MLTNISDCEVTFLQGKTTQGATDCIEFGHGSGFTVEEQSPSWPMQRMPRKAGKSSGLKPNIFSRYSLLFETVG